MASEDKDMSERTLQPPDDENLKSCWVCFATEQDDKLAAWVQPCKCIGTTKWVRVFWFIWLFQLQTNMG